MSTTIGNIKNTNIKILIFEKKINLSRVFEKTFEYLNM